VLILYSKKHKFDFLLLSTFIIKEGEKYFLTNLSDKKEKNPGAPFKLNELKADDKN
jgi:hypothetical protein